jgi:hypothetical protein
MFVIRTENLHCSWKAQQTIQQHIKNFAADFCFYGI